MEKDFLINTEQITKGHVVFVKIPKIEVEKFAMIILTLTNLKSSMKSSKILDISTVYETNNIAITFDYDNTEVSKRTVKYAIDINTMDLDYEISVLKEVDIVNISGYDLEEFGIVDDGFEIHIKGEY